MGPPLSGYDAVTCSLFLHHLDEPQALALLHRMAEMASRLVLVSDLQRGWTAWILTHIFTRLLTTSHVVHVDGPRSIEAAFTREEAQALADRAGLSGAKVHRRWPFRWLLSWRRPR
jgi:2-polyprenyl-3-methyl-5-hydroxy-6-metoxy-1,4-benzoquinol methylase